MLPVLWRRTTKGLPTLDEFFESFYKGWEPIQNEHTGRWQPAIDVMHEDDAVVLYADIPGMTKKDITIEVHDSVLTISGDRERTGRPEDYSRAERSHGRFERSFTLPDTVDAESIKASYRSGVLIVTLPKHPNALPRRIDVHEAE